MVTSFFAGTVDDWSDPTGQLHAYLVPEAQVVASLLDTLGALGKLPFLAIQPPEALHATVLRFPFLIGELPAGRLADLGAAAVRHCSGTGPLHLDFDEPHPTADSVLLRAAATGDWDALVDAARAAAVEALGEEARRYAPPPAPHLTLAYATAEGSDAQIVDALAGDGPPRRLGAVTFDALAWCAVHQNRDAGTYTFETLFETPLPVRTSASPGGGC